MPSQHSVSLCLLPSFLCQQRLSPGLGASDQLQPCLTSCSYPAQHAMHGPHGGTVPPSMNGKKRRSLLRTLMHMESSDLYFGSGK